MDNSERQDHQSTGEMYWDWLVSDSDEAKVNDLNKQAKLHQQKFILHVFYWAFCQLSGKIDLKLADQRGLDKRSWQFIKIVGGKSAHDG
jgi:hypothetical protein